MKKAYFALLVAGAAAPAAAEEAGDLSPPVRVMAGDHPLDCTQGHAAPCVADADGDGLVDLLVGQQGDVGQLRLYRNVGKAGQPKFESTFSLVKSGQCEVHVPTGCGFAGMIPQLVDLDGDGQKDIISGCTSGDTVLFRRNADGTFAPPSKLMMGTDGAETLNVAGGCVEGCTAGRLSSSYAVDWDGDGDMDLLLGTQNKLVHVSINTGTSKKPVWSTPTPLEAGGKPLEIPGGIAGICAADWDGDGKLDIVVGSGFGGVFLYHNSGTAKAAVLDAPVTLFAEPARPGKASAYSASAPAGRDVGGGLTPYVVDWNGDGRMDLVFGDVNKPTTEKIDLTDAEKNIAEMAQAKVKECYAEIEKLAKAPEDESVEQKEARESKITALKMEAMAAGKRASKYQSTRTISHGFIWVMLRKAPPVPRESASVR